jgi:hypothetical protein
MAAIEVPQEDSPEVWDALALRLKGSPRPATEAIEAIFNRSRDNDTHGWFALTMSLDIDLPGCSSFDFFRPGGRNIDSYFCFKYRDFTVVVERADFRGVFDVSIYHMDVLELVREAEGRDQWFGRILGTRWRLLKAAKETLHRDKIGDFVKAHAANTPFIKKPVPVETNSCSLL